MTELEKIVYPALLTIGGSIFVYVLGQVFSRYFIEPLQELRKTIGEVRFNLAFHAPIIHTPISRTQERSDAAYNAIMKSSCELVVRLQAVPLYDPISSIFCLPKRSEIESSATALRGLSTYVHETEASAEKSHEEIAKRVSAIEKWLNIKPLQ